MSYETLSVQTDRRGVATLSLNRPEKHNSLSARMIEDLTQAAQALGDDPAVRVVVLTGAGESFCAGGDLGWMRDQMQADAETRFREARKLAMMLKALNEMPKPLVGRVQGQAFGGGIGMCAVCDIAIAADHAMFGLTETRLGLIPATIGPYVLARMGEAMTRRVFMNGRRFGAFEAQRLGIVAEVAAEGTLDEIVEAQVVPYLACAPEAVARAKRLARRLGPPITEEVIDETIGELVACWEGQEARDGIAAFFDRRRPDWVQ
ncbi:crotonase/enoyl-CoA hydratase family protein [Maritimibacter sp. DP1N21-5]|uniref:crotonase/enoyl-CoA hydratase family protein n=1 Tax=Maritimibacter sp. DP1N21-5 TaxID=2836867 RepID=UPI001C43CB43|nr:crotonase/enoyl-CoA hydratase family protein [Maritimibacter sp. DP1N21-5]MBV7409441.1 crotonase/enoyl-CoA hydratase family protein [Maritimibacter sp. DP1N21-5]